MVPQGTARKHTLLTVGSYGLYCVHHIELPTTTADLTGNNRRRYNKGDYKGKRCSGHKILTAAIAKKEKLILQNPKSASSYTVVYLKPPPKEVHMKAPY